MLVIFLICFIVFIGVFYLANLFYPALEKQATFWHKKKIDQMSPKIDRMFLDISVTRLILLDIASPIITGLIAYYFTHNRWIILAAVALGFAIPPLVIKYLEKRRRQKFSRQLVDAINILCSSLKVGMSFQQAFEVLVEEMTPPISQEFSLVLRQMQMGYSLEAALKDLKKRMQLDELDMMISTILVAKETGGDITDTLNKVANTIIERNKIVGKVKALTIQGKLQGLIMSLIPIVFALFVYKADPHFFDVFFQDTFGKALLTYVVISQILGTFFIIKLSKVDV